MASGPEHYRKAEARLKDADGTGNAGVANSYAQEALAHAKLAEVALRFDISAGDGHVMRHEDWADATSNG